MHAPSEYEPLLKTFFTVSYVALAAFVGAFADSMPKWRVMFISNAIKIVGCSMMFFGAHPLLAYAVVGLGAAAYSPAKYGILTEYLPHRLLVVANGWIEGLTVGAIILGVVIGGTLIQPESPQPARLRLPADRHRHRHHRRNGALFRRRASICSPRSSTSTSRHRRRSQAAEEEPVVPDPRIQPLPVLLWRDKLGQISLAVTTLFWGAGATLQFIVIKWAEVALQPRPLQIIMLQGVVAIGVAAGAILAPPSSSPAQIGARHPARHRHGHDRAGDEFRP
jgi:LPLT family lysophospholipid transporter-like MFS transporter